LGIAVGILGYYGITDNVTRMEQRQLKASTPVALFEATVRQDGPTLDFEQWEQEDGAYWESLESGEAFARIVSPAMGLDALVVKGVARADLRKGPGWITYTDLPGPTGNVGISGHRTTYGAPFRRLDRLRSGDTIELFSPFRRYTYRVRKTFSVTPDKTEVVESTDDPTLTLTACHPPYSAALRLIVQADLIEVGRMSRQEDPQ
jgi:LPXTG-site transpeptidase (sortase) family protein